MQKRIDKVEGSKSRILKLGPNRTIVKLGGPRVQLSLKFIISCVFCHIFIF